MTDQTPDPDTSADTSAETSTSTTEPDDADPIDAEAAAIDPRDPDAPEQVEALIDHAETLGRDAGLDELPDSP